MSKTRFEDTNGLFGSEEATGTCGNFSCDWCGVVSTERQINEEGERTADGNIFNSTVNTDRFGRINVAHCCYCEIEENVLLAMPRILPWFLRLIKDKREKSPQLVLLMERILEALKEEYEK